MERSVAEKSEILGGNQTMIFGGAPLFPALRRHFENLNKENCTVDFRRGPPLPVELQSSSSIMEEVTHHRQPNKKTKLESRDGIIAEHQYESHRCHLEPLLQKITMASSLNYKLMSDLLQQIQTSLVLEDAKKFKMTSVAALRRVLTVRLGYAAGYQSDASGYDSCEDVERFQALTIQCLGDCYIQNPSNAPETLEAFDTVLRLLRQPTEPRGQILSECLKSASFHHICFDIIEIWLNNDPSLLWHMLEQRKCQSSLDDMLLLWIQLAKTEPAMESRIVKLLQHQCQKTTSILQMRFQTALTVLNVDSKAVSNVYSECPDKNWLFSIRCRAVAGDLDLATSEMERLLGLLRPSCAISAETMDALALFTDQMHCEHQKQSIEAVMDILLYENNPDLYYGGPLQADSLLQISALSCLEKLLSPSISSDLGFLQPARFEDFLEWCSELVSGNYNCLYPMQNIKDRNIAAVILLKLIPNAVNRVTTEKQKRRYLTTMSQIIREPLDLNIISQSVRLCCDWMYEDGARTTVLRHGPEILFSMAHLVCCGQASEGDKLQIARAFSMTLQTERECSLLARESKILESIVIMASSLSSPISSIIATQTRNVAITVLLSLSENPCHRRILARHPGLLSTLIHFVRHMPSRMEDLRGENLNYGAETNSEMKQQILLLAKAL